MAEDRTTPLALTEVPIRTLAVEVTAGPDAGRSAVATSDTLHLGTAAEGNDLVLTDPTVSRFHLSLTLGPAGILAVDRGSTNGTYADAVRIERAVLARGATLRLGQTHVRLSQGPSSTYALHPGEALAGMRGRSLAMRKTMARIERAAQAPSAVLVVGESGTGKELVARALHDLGPRADKPFVTVDCGALAPTLVASELFGHERGAFTGADARHVGAFERAHGGTLFLDEVGELPASLQASLLGVLERRRFQRLGGRAEIAVDVRLVAATNRDLRAEVNAGAFRLDLYYRLAVLTIELPPLRERPEDIPLLVEHFLREAGCDGPVAQYVSPETLADFARHRWPGNVRELRNLVESILAMGEAPVFPASEPGAPGASAQGGEAAGSGAAGLAAAFAPLIPLPYKRARAALVDAFEAEYLRALFARCGGNVSRAAREAQLDRSHLRDLLRRQGLRGAKDDGGGEE